MAVPKKKLVVSYDNLPPGVFPCIEKQYPDGWMNHVMKVKGARDTHFYAILVETEEIDYLVKVKVKKDRKGVETEEDFIPEFDEISPSSSSSSQEESYQADNQYNDGNE